MRKHDAPPSRSIVFLVECGAKHGIGHLRRSQVLAKYFMSQGWQCLMKLTDTELINEVREEGYLATFWHEHETEPSEVDVLVADGYYFDRELLVRAKQQGSLVIVIDDLAERPVTADIVLNHNLYGDSLDYHSYSTHLVLGGADYSLVSPRFLLSGKVPKPKKKSVLLSFGGTDRGQFSLPLARLLLESNHEVCVKVMLARNSDRQAEFDELSDEFPKQLVLCLNGDMAFEMQSCHLFVGAAGVVILEALAARLHVVGCCTFDNQKLNFNAIRKAGHVCLRHFDPEKLCEAVFNRLNMDIPIEGNMLIDGKGAERVYNKVTALLAE